MHSPINQHQEEESFKDFDFDPDDKVLSKTSKEMRFPSVLMPEAHEMDNLSSSLNARKGQGSAIS